MSAKHTPGPWTAQNDGRDIISIQHSNNDPGAISMTLAKVTARMTWRSQAEANASLIAAAPELLEALQDYDDAFTGFDPSSKESRHRMRLAVIKARTAIAKAIG